jgi:hypothetical protein
MVETQGGSRRRNIIVVSMVVFIITDKGSDPYLGVPFPLSTVVSSSNLPLLLMPLHLALLWGAQLPVSCGGLRTCTLCRSILVVVIDHPCPSQESEEVS